MKNTYKILWTDEALDNLADIIEYLEHRWTKREIKNFSRLLDQRVKLIRSNLEPFPMSLRLQKLSSKQYRAASSKRIPKPLD